MVNKVQCVKCKAIFKNESKTATQHAKEVHHGKHYDIQAVDSQTNTTRTCKKRKLQHIEATQSFSVPEIEINIEHAPQCNTIVESNEIETNPDDELPSNTKCEDSVDFGNLWNDVTTENGSQSSGAPGSITWATFVDSLGDLVQKLQDCKDMYESARQSEDLNQELGAIDIINAVISVKEVSTHVVELGNQFLQQPFDSNNKPSRSLHDPAHRPPKMTDSQRQYLINLGPHQPRLAKFPTDGKNRFSVKWYDEYEHLEYSLERNAAFCFTCSLFPREKGEDAWACAGVKSWSKMKSRGKDKPGKLQQHFFSEAHKASVRDYYLSFSASG